MAYNSIDMQISLPRAPEGSARQSHEAQKPIDQQTLLEQGAAKETEAKRSQSGAVEQSGMKGVKGEQRRESGKSAKRRPFKEADGPEPDRGGAPPQHPGHPTKGRHIDISL
ncbi:hypothetical protein [Paenibacillus humicola]|uniref:hypothetical protein n=1 Tax=Paenibacillus humicola TaxID=3110540 RepID=UPI00237A0DD6|nr:hypothetical protein [Paenibacillus humicola]